MSLHSTYSFSPASAVQVQNSQTVTIERIVALNKSAEKFVGNITFGNLSQSGTLSLEVYTGLESNTSAAWESLAITSISASSASSLAFASSTKPLLPYAKLTVRAKAAGAAATLFENIAAKLVTD